jgi:hypothetical protein
MISASEIAAREQSRRNLRKDTYKTLLEQFSRKIKACVDRHEQCAVLVVPPFVMGFPMYPFDEALAYTRRQLERSGYQVRQGMEPGQFVVTWEKARKKVARTVEPDAPQSDDLFSSLANLQKTAARLRGSAP